MLLLVVGFYRIHENRKTAQDLVPFLISLFSSSTCYASTHTTAHQQQQVSEFLCQVKDTHLLSPISDTITWGAHLLSLVVEITLVCTDLDCLIPSPPAENRFCNPIPGVPISG